MKLTATAAPTILDNMKLVRMPKCINLTVACRYIVHDCIIRSSFNSFKLNYFKLQISFCKSPVELALHNNRALSDILDIIMFLYN